MKYNFRHVRCKNRCKCNTTHTVLLTLFKNKFAGIQFWPDWTTPTSEAFKIVLCIGVWWSPSSRRGWNKVIRARTLIKDSRLESRWLRQYTQLDFDVFWDIAFSKSKLCYWRNQWESSLESLVWLKALIKEIIVPKNYVLIRSRFLAISVPRCQKRSILTRPVLRNGWEFSKSFLSKSPLHHQGFHCY